MNKINHEERDMKNLPRESAIKKRRDKPKNLQTSRFLSFWVLRVYSLLLGTSTQLQYDNDITST
jgi:hypothetical protein